MSIYSHGEGAEVGAVEHILTGGGLAYTHILRLSSQIHAEGAEIELHILTWDGADQTRLKSNVYSDGKGSNRDGV